MDSFRVLLYSGGSDGRSPRPRASEQNLRHVPPERLHGTPDDFSERDAHLPVLASPQFLLLRCLCLLRYPKNGLLLARRAPRRVVPVCRTSRPGARQDGGSTSMARGGLLA